MPNWTHTQLNLKYVDPNQFKDIVERITNDQNHIDFNKLVPQPEGLFTDDAGSVSDLKEYLRILYHENKETFIESLSQIPSRRREAILFTLEHSTKLPGESSNDYKFDDEEQAMLESFYATGFFSWYDWNTQNWGTKWNAIETDIDFQRQRIEFDTAWDWPRPVIQAMADTFNITFSGIAIFEDGDPETIYVEPTSRTDD